MRWHLVVATVLIVGIFFYLGQSRLKLDTNILDSLALDDPVILDAQYVMDRHSILDRVVMDLSLRSQDPDPDRLVAASKQVKEALFQSGLFQSLGTEELGQGFPAYLELVSETLPFFLNPDDLEKRVTPRLQPEFLDSHFSRMVEELSEIAGIGQSALISQDPLKLRELVLQKLGSLYPSAGAQIYRGQILSADGRHLLLPADPISKGTDSRFAQKLDATFKQINSRALGGTTFEPEAIRLVPVGSYRAALDNENIARQDAQNIVIWVSVLTLVLLILCFPRPLFGVLSMLPGFVGPIIGLLVYSFFKPSMSVLTLGFGGVIISFTVDQGIAYLLFLDQKQEVSGNQASQEIWTATLLTSLTNALAFVALVWSGFSILGELGLFAALGITFTFLFVHFVFSKWFHKVKAARRESILPIDRISTWMALSGGRGAAWIAAGLACVLAVFAWPQFKVDLRDMNTVSAETLQAEKSVQEVWGEVYNRVYVLLEGNTLNELQDRADRLAQLIESEISRGTLESGYSPSLVFPGPKQAEQNLLAWKEFWNGQRIQDHKKNLAKVAVKYGFRADAFDPFLQSIENPRLKPLPLREEILPLLGIVRNSEGRGWVAMCPLTPSATYNREAFFQLVSSQGIGRLLDANLFSERLSHAVVVTFTSMLCICSVGIILILLLYFLDWVLVLICLIPVFFSLICTLGTLRWIGHPLDIPGLLLAIVVMGMSIEYPLHYVVSHQRYLDEHHPSFNRMRSVIFLTSATTLIGLGVLASAQHAMLKSAGLTCFLAIFYSVIATFAILPPLLRRVFSERLIFNEGQPNQNDLVPGSNRHRKQVLLRYRHLETYPRQFARFKMLLDPMFPKLASWVRSESILMDVGCGFGVPGVWLSIIFPQMKVFASDPNPERVRVAQRALGKRGVVSLAQAPQLPVEPARAGTALMLDMAHYLSDDELRATLADLRIRLMPQGRLVIRVIVPGSKRFPWERWLETAVTLARRQRILFRSREQWESLIRSSGFRLEYFETSSPSREETWLVASPFVE